MYTSGYSHEQLPHFVATTAGRPHSHRQALKYPRIGWFLLSPVDIVEPTDLKEKQQLPLLSLSFTFARENYPIYFLISDFFLSFNKGTFSSKRIKNASWEYNNLLCNAERIVSSCVIKTFQVSFLSDEHTNTCVLPDGVHYVCLHHFDRSNGTRRVKRRTKRIIQLVVRILYIYSWQCIISPQGTPVVIVPATELSP